MISRLAVISLLSFILLGSSPNVQCSTVESSPLLTRKIVTNDGEPIPDVQVSIYTFGEANQSSPKWRIQTTTDATGEFKVPRKNTDPRWTFFVFRKPGFAVTISQTSLPLEVSPGPTVLQPLSLTPTFVVKGIVEYNGRSVNRALLTIKPNYIPAQFIRQILAKEEFEYHADERGNFSLDGIVEESGGRLSAVSLSAQAKVQGRQSVGVSPVKLRITKTTHSTHSSNSGRMPPANPFDDHDSSSEQYPLIISILPLYVLKGHIVDWRGHPVSGAVVQLREPRALRTETDVTGHFEVKIMDGQFAMEGDISIVLPGNTRVSSYVWDIPESSTPEDHDIKIKLPRLTTISGRVFLPGGLWSYDDIHLYTEWQEGNLTFRSSCQISGAALIPGGAHMAPFRIRVPVGELELYTNYSWKLRQAGQPDLSPRDDYFIDVYPGEKLPPIFRINATPQGTSGLEFFARPRHNDYSQPVIDWQVLSPEGLPVASADVWLVSDTNSVVSFQHCITDANGKFLASQFDLYRKPISILIAAPGSNILQGTSVTYTPRSPFYADEDAKPASPPRTIRLQPGATLTGRVVDDKGSPMAGVYVYHAVGVLRDVQGLSVFKNQPIPRPLWTVTDANGCWTLPALKLSSSTVKSLTAATMEDKQIWSGGIFANPMQEGEQETSKTPDIVIRPTTTLRGLVLDENKRPLPDTTISVYDLYRMKELVAVPFAGVTRTDKNGRFVLENLPLEALVATGQFNLIAKDTTLGKDIFWIRNPAKYKTLKTWIGADEITFQFSP